MNTTKHLSLHGLFSKTLYAFMAIVTLCSAKASAQSNLKSGWDYFEKNDFAKSREYFTKATDNDKDKPEAYLMLAVLATIDKTEPEAFANFEKFYESAPDPIPYIDAVLVTDIGFGGYGKKTKVQLDMLNKLLKDPRASGTLKDNIHSIIGSHYEYIQEDKKSFAEYNNIKTIDKWQIVGTFDNISASGFDKDYGPIKYVKTTDGFKDENGAPINWFNLPPSRKDKWIDFTYNFSTDDAICYAQTFVNSPDDRTVQFRIGVSGSLKTWVNDALVFAEPEERNNGEDSYIFNIKLNKGYNRILVQVGSSEIDRCNFMARITDDAGYSLDNITATSEPQDYKKSTADAKATVIPVPSEAYFEKKIAADPNDLINYIALINEYLTNSKNYEARKLILKAQALAPRCSYFYYKLIEVYNRDGNNTDLEIAINWLKDNDPDNPLSIELLYNDEMDKEHYKAATDLVDKMEKLYGETALSKEYRIRLAAKDGKQDELVQDVEQGYKKYPDDWYYVNLERLVQESVNKNSDAAIDVLKKFLKNNFHESAYTDIAKYYFDKGKNADGIEQYETLLKKYPYAVGYYKNLGDVYFEEQKYDPAVANYKKCLEFAPYISTYWNCLAKCYDNQNKADEAKDAYKKAILYSPTNYDARSALRKLENKKEIFDYFEQPDLEALFKKSPDASKYPDDNSIVLHEETQKVVYSGGASEERTIYLVKVFNAEGIDNWKEYSIGYYSSQRLIIEKAEVLKANGDKVEAETDENKVVFKSLEPGDAICLIYHKQNYAIGKMSPYFSDKHFFSYHLPYLESKYSLLISPDINLNYRFSKDTIIPKISTADEFKFYQWSKENQPSLKNEDKMPALVDVAQVLYLSSFPNWTYVSHWYTDLSATKAKSDFEVKETVASLLKGKENESDKQKVETIYNYIVKNIRYSSVSFLQSGLIPQKASHVINSKIGDCKDVSTLFVAMCKEAKIPAQLILVNTKNNGEKDMLLPGIDFNHCIAKCTIDNHDQYVELTSDYLPFNSYYNGLLNSFALDIKSDKDQGSVAPFFIDPPNRYINAVTRVSNVNLSGDDIIIDRTSYKTGQYAASMRESYRDMGPTERQKEMQKNVADEYANLQLDSLKFTGLDSRNDTVAYRYILTGSNAVSHVGGLSIFTLPWVDKATSKDFTFEANRQFPMDVSGYYALESDAEQIYMNIPAGQVLSEIPKNIKYSCSVADYTLDFKVLHNKISVYRRLKFKESKIPVDKIPEFKEFYKEVITADAKQIALKGKK